jgi:actin-related protein
MVEFEFSPKYDLIKEEDIKLFMTNIPKELNKNLIKRLLLELPQQITFNDNLALEFKKDIGDAKATLKARKGLLEIEKSEVRKLEIDKFQQQHDVYMQRTQDLMREIMNSNEQNASLKKAYLQEVSKAIKPERPTKSDLDDIANIKTRHLQEEIDGLEQRISDSQFHLEILSTKKDFYNNMWVTLRKYADVVVNEMRMLGEH